MDDLIELLKGCKKLVIMGVGNELKGDDAIGVYVIKRLMNYFIENNNLNNEILKIKNLYLINAGTVPDFYTDILKEIKPTHIIIIDCALMNEMPGKVKIIKEDEIINYSLSTHTLPISFIIKYLKNFVNFDVIIIGIQPKVIDFCPMSKEVIESGDKLIETLINCIKKLNLTE